MLGDVELTRFDDVSQIVDEIRKDCVVLELHRFAMFFEKCQNHLMWTICPCGVFEMLAICSEYIGAN